MPRAHRSTRQGHYTARKQGQRGSELVSTLGVFATDQDPPLDFRAERELPQVWTRALQANPADEGAGPAPRQPEEEPSWETVDQVPIMVP